jgi:hypothetical protein
VPQRSQQKVKISEQRANKKARDHNYYLVHREETLARARRLYKKSARAKRIKRAAKRAAKRPIQCECPGCTNTFIRFWRTFRKRFCSPKCLRKFWNAKQPGNFNHKRYQKWKKKATPEEILIHSVRARMQKHDRKHFKFAISVKDIRVPEFCPVLGIKLAPKGKKGNPALPSIDRIDSNKGYIPGNVRVISYRANALKSNATLEELELVLADARRLASSASGEDFRQPVKK